jgi:hypothetical protein
MFQMPSAKAMADYKIPKKRPAEIGTAGPSSAPQVFDTTTPGAATGNLQPGPELIKRARTMRFEGRLDKGT